jgi:hypothetical protein
MGKLRWAPVLFERFHARECEARKTAWEREKAKAPSAKKKEHEFMFVLPLSHNPGIPIPEP